jgi:thymidine kinase
LASSPPPNNSTLSPPAPMLAPIRGYGGRTAKLLGAALDYQERGFSIIPIRPDKRPYIKWEEFQKRRATKQEITAWWNKWPTAMIGIVTGSISGIVVIDIDEPQGHDEIQKYIPDSLVVPTSQTSGGGQHLYFKCPSQAPSNNARVISGCDFRGEGGYIIAPPSINGTGKPYAWLPGLSIAEVEPPPLPNAYLEYINRCIKGGEEENQNSSSNAVKLFTQGRRDDDLFHVANHLVKGGMAVKEIEQVLERLSLSCDPPFPLQEAKIKIQSALKRAQLRERNLAEEVRQWVLSSSGVITSSEVAKCLQLSSREGQKNLSRILSRLKEEGIIEKHGERNGCFRICENLAEPVDFLNAPTTEFPITWPLGVHSLCTIYPGNIIVVAGSKSAGKTAFLLNTVQLNQDRHEIVYLNSEMGDTEFRKRLELFEGMKLTDWKFKAYHRSSNFEDLVTGERKVFIIDFLEITTDFWKVAEYIQGIHRKLKEGVAVIALQKSDSKEAGRGGDFSKEKSRLYLSLDYLPEVKKNRVKIVDAKAWRGNQNPRGLYRHYKLVNGSRFLAEDPWRE